MYAKAQVISILLLGSVQSMLRYPSTQGKFFYLGVDDEIDPTTFDLQHLDNMFHVNVFVGSNK